jgi:hypothetical protein
MNHKITLRVAGELFDVLFDGIKVTTPEFPQEPVDFTSRCGVKITQEMLVEVCKHKIEQERNQTNERNT